MRRRGSVMFIVMWAIAVGALVLSSVQLFGYRQAMLGRQAIGRMQARWAARGGIEYTIAVMADHTTDPVPEDAMAMTRDMGYIWTGDFEANGRLISSYDIRHNLDGRAWQGPMDEHSKLNINATLDNPSLLTNLDDMYQDVADAILDWIDEDDEERSLGAERHYYLSLTTPVQPRNAPMRSVAELEHVAGMWPEHVRGEDWNLNDRLDANEDDGERTWPPDDPDHLMEGGWAALLTTHSVSGGLSDSGLPRIDLTQTDAAALVERLGIDEQQAADLIAFAQNDDARLEQLLTTHVQQVMRPDEIERGGVSGSAGGPRLTADELRLVFAETTIGSPDARGPGRLNINTVSEELLRQLLVDQEQLADEILYLRTRLEGIVSMVDLTEIPAFQENTETLEFVAGLMDTRSNVYSVSSRGKSWGTGVEVEIKVVVDRSTVPIRILEYRE